MNDVRLVATNPEDSSLVPVATNARGQLAVQSPKIEKVPNDLDVQGDISATGAIHADSTVGSEDGTNRAYLNPGAVNIQNASKDSTTAFSIEGGRGSAEQDDVVTMTTAGSITAAGTVESDAFIVNKPSGGDTSGCWATYLNGVNTSLITGDGSITAAGTISVGNTAKAGFTKEGYLWCTTRRGDTVILDATSNGLGTWADYTPPTRKELAKEKIEEALEVLKQEPQVSQQLPETEADTP